MRILELQQGTQAWAAHRAAHWNASDAPAMLGISPYKTRAQLLREHATGIKPDVDAATQARFDAGHHTEALARPLAEAIVGEDLSPCVGEEGRYSASFDGITFDGAVAWECKTANDALRAVMPENSDGNGVTLPAVYRAQLEHQAMVSGCERILFTAARFDANDRPIDVRHCWYSPDPDLRARIVSGWGEFERDLSNWQPEPEAAPVVPKPVESLPVPVVRVDGALTVAGNLDQFGAALRVFIAKLPEHPATDQEFADTEAACKALKKAEDALTAAEDGALAQISNVDAMRRAVADLKSLARTTRLRHEKLVASEKGARKLEIVREADQALRLHIDRANSELHRLRAGSIGAPQAAIFAAVIGGLKSLDSMHEKVTAALLAEKANVDAMARRLRTNRALLQGEAHDFIFLFPDFDQVGAVPVEQFAMIVEGRIAQHEAREAKRLEAERARIRAEEESKAKAAADAAVAKLAAQAEAEARAEAAKAAAAAQTAKIEQAKAEVIQQLTTEPNHLFVARPATKSNKETEQPTLTLSAINERLAPIHLTAAGLAHFGIEPMATDKSAKLFSEGQFFNLLCELTDHLDRVMSKVRRAQTETAAA